MSRMKLTVAFASLALVATAALALAGTPTGTRTSQLQTQPSTAAPKSHMTGAKHAMTPRIDLNSATSDDLQKLPGIDAATADKIVAARPFKSRSELLSRKLVTKAEYSKLASRITVKAEPKAAAAK